MHRMVDGKRVAISLKEEKEIRARWEKNTKDEETKKFFMEEKKREEYQVLHDCGLSNEAIAILVPELCVQLEKSKNASSLSDVDIETINKIKYLREKGLNNEEIIAISPETESFLGDKKGSYGFKRQRGKGAIV